MRHHLLALSLVAAVSVGFFSSCGKNNGTSNNGGTNNATNNNDEPDADGSGEPDAATPDMGSEDSGGPITRAPLRCDANDPGNCAYPWPSSLYLEPDETRETGYTLTFGARTLPANTSDFNVEPDVYRRRDGYSVGTSIMALFPHLDSTLLPDETRIAESLSDDAHMVLLRVDAAGNTARVPFWVDYDAHEDDPAIRSVIAHPAVILDPATRYVVAFRNLADTNGDAIARSDAFQALIDGATDDDPELFFRQERFDEIFTILDGLGWTKDELNLAWDFVTASEASVKSHVLHMIDDAFATTGAEGPELTVTDVVEFTEAEDEFIAAEVSGTITVPHYMRPFRGMQTSPQRWELNLDDDGTPQQNGTRDAKFWIRIPRSALDGTPHGLVMYGHGLLGSGTQVRGSFNGKIANDNNLIFFAADMIGMSEEEGNDAPLEIVADFNKFPILGDRLMQGMTEWVLLTRAMKERFATHTEATSRGVVINPDEVFYSGISQGGIFGGTFVALSPDVDRGHLGVPGHTYSVLLHRSVDFDLFFTAMQGSYPDPRDQIVLLSLAQLLWDATDPVSYYRNLTVDPLPGRNPKAVLFAAAKGDYQVAVIQNEVAARTDNGIELLENYDDERAPDLITPVPYPHTGSGVVLYDYDDEWPAPGNHTSSFPFGDACQMSSECDEGNGWFCSGGRCSRDPHGKPRREDHHNEQMVEFFRTGTIIDVCGGDGCHPD